MLKLFSLWLDIIGYLFWSFWLLYVYLSLGKNGYFVILGCGFNEVF